jgi:uncharacterized cupredoxin-like copper-binding protein
MRRASAVLLAATAAAAIFGGAAVAGPGATGHSHQTFAAGEPGDPKKPARAVAVIMREGDGKMLYLPDRIEVKRGEQIRFILRNEGELDHEFMLDTKAHNQKHAELMQKHPEMEHDDPNGKQLKPKTSTELLWRFTKAGTFEFACLHPGHYDAGMKGVVVVASGPSTAHKKTNGATKKNGLGVQ